MDIVKQLVDIYFNEETWHNEIMSLEEAIRYHLLLLSKDQIICYIKDNRIIGYLEYWKLNLSQLERLFNNGVDSIEHPYDDIENGNILYISNLWVSELNKENRITKKLIKQMFIRNLDINYACGYENKYNRNSRIFKNRSIYKGEKDGWRKGTKNI